MGYCYFAEDEGAVIDQRVADHEFRAGTLDPRPCTIAVIHWVHC